MSADSNGRAWDWADGADHTVIPEQPAIACYTNPAGAVVLRQNGAWNDDEDAWIFFAPEHAAAIAAAILETAGMVDADIAELAPEPAQDAIKPMASPAAARQKRYRQRKKKEPALFDGEDSDVTRDVTRDESDA